ncbi:antitoxin VapB family protein [Candidatus Woesearchaeota archaeon]|nr:antitoxin VapB family protein [Candidatus Woesearchaeota archaeon]
MATKCITITVEAYDRLRSQKQERESFSDVIARITPKKSSLLDLVGLLSPKEADDMKKHIAVSRKITEERMNKIAEMMR